MLRILISLLLAATTLSNAAEWQKLEGCTLVTDEYRDGDSFHVTTGDKDYIFRLYFVDTPETDTRFPNRVAEQAAYFNLSPGECLRLGETAATFTARALVKPFAVWTKFQDARGSSKQHRFYAMVQTSAGQLSSLLVANGLARVFGVNVALPTGESATAYVAKLKALEAQAKASKRGGWGGSPAKGSASISADTDPKDEATDDIPAF